MPLACQTPASPRHGGCDAPLPPLPNPARPAMTAQGLEAAYLELRPALLRYLAARGAGARAEDVLQDLWVQLVRAGPVANPVAYLYRSAENLWRNEVRAAARRERREIDAGADQLPEPLPDAALAARQMVLAARARLAAAGERVEAAFVLTRVEGRTQQEAARLLGVSLSTIEKDLRRAQVELARIVEEGDGA